MKLIGFTPNRKPFHNKIPAGHDFMTGGDFFISQHFFRTFTISPM